MKSHILLMSLLGLALFFSGCDPLPCRPQESHPFTVNDLLTMGENPKQPLISPDGQWVVFCCPSHHRYGGQPGEEPDLWLADTTGKSPAASRAIRRPTILWSADGKTVYFLSTRSGSAQVWAVPVNGGEAVQITDLPLDGELLLSPKGERLLLSLRSFPPAPPWKRP